jgi:hypothetical protein
MGLLKRSTPPLYDEHMTYFTVAQADEFRRLVARSFAAVGRDVDVYPDRVEDRGGTTIGLWNIGALCAGTDALEWPQLIDDHVRLVATPACDLADVTEAEFASGLTLRLVEAGSVPDPDALGYARLVAPGLLEVLAVDLGDAVATPSRDELAGRGTLAGLVALARENLRTLLEGETVRSGTVGGNGTRGRFTALRGQSLFTASLALVLPETMERFTGDEDWGRGVLVAVPTRHELLYRLIDTADARLALQHMVQAAFLGFHGEVGQLSPDVFWVRKEKWVQVTSSASGKPRVVRGTGLREALASL